MSAVPPLDAPSLPPLSSIAAIIESYSSYSTFVPVDPLLISPLLAVPLHPRSDYSPIFWFVTSFFFWIVLHACVINIAHRVCDAAQHVHRIYMRRRGRYVSNNSIVIGGVLMSEQQSWGTIVERSYDKLTPSKRAYMRRILRSLVYYVFAISFGWYYMLTCFSTLLDTYFVYTPSMDRSFCFAASHFIFCCFEDWPCRAQMGKTNCEQMSVFWGYIVHHVLTAAAYISGIYTQEIGMMCVMGLTFEGPVLFSVLREFVSLYDSDFNLFEKVPKSIMKLNWYITFISLIPCRYMSVLLFSYTAIFTRDHLVLISPAGRYAYWTFGSAFILINIYFTWLLTYWYKQDERYLAKKSMLKQQGKDNKDGTKAMRMAGSTRRSDVDSDANAMIPLIANHASTSIDIESGMTPSSSSIVSSPSSRLSSSSPR